MLINLKAGAVLWADQEETDLSFHPSITYSSAASDSTLYGNMTLQKARPI